VTALKALVLPPPISGGKYCEITKTFIDPRKP
jgi:hypothetical protein